MKKIALEFINIIENHGFKAYIVGGFVRDYLMNINSHDIDITTSATPKEIKKIFADITIKKNINDENSYGSARVLYKNITFEVTTFREELDYRDNRHPSEVFYVNDLNIDLKRRDFTINAICMDKDGKIIDPLNGQSDISKRIIRTINNPAKSFKDDALRILRAIRFSTTLNFKLDKDIEEAIEITKKYLKNISYERKKIELDKIFASKNAKDGITLIIKLDLASLLDLNNLDKINDYTDLNLIWTIINSSKYPFTKHEKELMKKINLALHYDNLNPHILYKYGLYVNTLAGINKGISKVEITKAYNDLVIKTRTDIDIDVASILKVLNQEPGPFLNHIYKNLEIEILNGNLENKKDEIINYIKKHFN